MPFEIRPGENLIAQFALLDLPDGANFLGAYDNAHPYVALDVVVEAEVAYVCILATTGHTPPNGTYWTALSAIAATSVLSFIFQLVAAGGRATLTYSYDGVTLPANMLLVDGLATIEVLGKDTQGLTGAFKAQLTVTTLNGDYFVTGGQTDVVCEDNVIEVAPC
jgi:hypothetical protein